MWAFGTYPPSVLRHIDLWECQGVTNEGVQYLSSLGLHVEL